MFTPKKLQTKRKEWVSPLFINTTHKNRNIQIIAQYETPYKGIHFTILHLHQLFEGGGIVRH